MIYSQIIQLINEIIKSKEHGIKAKANSQYAIKRLNEVLYFIEPEEVK